MKGDLSQLLLSGQDEKAYETARWYKKIFDDDYYIEVQDHGLKEQSGLIPKLDKLSKDLDIPLVATNNVHYMDKEDAEIIEVLGCLKNGNKLSDPDRPVKSQTDELYFKSAEEMKSLFADNIQWIDATLEIADKCNFEFVTDKFILPEFTAPENYSVDDYFEHICREGFKKKVNTILQKNEIDAYMKRLDHEINIIIKNGLAGYFLILWDIVKFAEGSGIPVGPGRGPVVGSLVACVMGITKVDPLEYDLLFERFFNPERASMPDIDLDLETERRCEVIDHIREKYGENNTAQIITFGKMKVKMVLRDLGSVLGLSMSEVNQIAEMIPDGPGIQLKSEIDSNPGLLELIKQKPEIKKLIELTLKLEDNVRHTSAHAAAVVIAPDRITEYIPLYKTKDDIVTQFGKDDIDNIGLFQIDILGLNTLTINRNILDEIYKIEGKEIILDNIPTDDEKTYKIFQTGDTDGVFQFESTGMKELLKRSKPENIEDLISLKALYRPGPLNSGMTDSYIKKKTGKENVIYIFPELEPILKNTCGLIIYQEQIMQIFTAIAGFTPGKADEMRKALKKKSDQKVPLLQAEFIAGAVKKGFNKKKTEQLFSQMKEFAQYGSNKSHSAAYALLAYQTAYLKANFPVYFMAALLTKEATKTLSGSRIEEYLLKCKKMGIKILPPENNKHFMVKGNNSIKFGLNGSEYIKGSKKKYY